MLRPIACLLVVVPLLAQQPEPAYTVEAGVRVPLLLTNTVSTKRSSPGDRVYFETAFPITVDGKIVIPAKSYVEGSLTRLKKDEFEMRFDTLTLPNGIARNIREVTALATAPAEAGVLASGAAVQMMFAKPFTLSESELAPPRKRATSSGSPSPRLPLAPESQLRPDLLPVQPSNRI